MYNLRLPCVQPPTLYYNLQIAYVHCTASNFLMVIMVIMAAMIAICNGHGGHSCYDGNGQYRQDLIFSFHY